MPAPSPLPAIVKRADLPALQRALTRVRGPVPPAAIIAAAGQGWKAGLELLRKHGADLNATFKNYRPLHAAIQSEPGAIGSSAPGRVACLEWLLKNGADPELHGAWPAARPLVIAAFSGEPACVAALAKAGARIDVFTAAALGRAKTISRLLAEDSGRSLARDGGTLTALQCGGGSRLGRKDRRTAAGLLSAAEALVAAGADVNARTRTFGHDVDVAHFVIRSGQVPMLEFLLGHGLDATAAIVTAAFEGREDILDLLLAHGGRLDAAREGSRPILNELVRWGQFTQARLLLSKGASPDIPDERGWTSMHQAASRGNVKMLEDLLAAGGDPSRPDLSGRTPSAIARGKILHRLLNLRR